MNKPKRILILSSGYFPNLVAGAEVAIKEITDRIDPKEYAFDMLTLRFDSGLPKFEKLGNVNVYRLGMTKAKPNPKDLVGFPLYLNKVIFPLLAVLKFRSLDRQYKYDGLWTMMSYMGMVAALIRIFVRPIKLVLTLQEGDNFEHILRRKRIRLFVPLIKKGFRDASVIQAISNYLANWARDMGAKNVVLVPNGVDVEKFKDESLKLKAGEIRKKYGVGEGEKVVITTSRLVEKNGVDLLIKAMKFLPPDVKLLIVGNGPLLSNLQLTTNNLQLNTRVIFGDFVPQESIPSYLAAADVFARPSRSEGQGISFIEAMAAGVPVVATAVGGITDFLEDKKTGLICRVDDPEDLARKINILLRDEEIRRNVTENASRLVEQRYDWQPIVDSMRSNVFSHI